MARDWLRGRQLTHAEEDNGKKVVYRVPYRCDAEKDKGKDPNLEVGSGLQKGSKGKGLRYGVSSIAVDAANDKVALLLGQKVPRPMSLFWKPHEEEVGDESTDARDDAFDDEDPPPAAQAGQAVHLREAKGEDTAEGGGDAPEAVKGHVALLHVVARVPGAQEVDGAGKVAGLEDTGVQQVSTDGLEASREASWTCPIKTRRPARLCHDPTKPFPIMTRPQARAMELRKHLGPSFRVRRVPRGWKTV